MIYSPNDDDDDDDDDDDGCGGGMYVITNKCALINFYFLLFC